MVLLVTFGSPHVPTQLQRGAKMFGRRGSQVSPENRLRVWVKIGGISNEGESSNKGKTLFK